MNDASFARTADTELGQERLMELVEEIGERLRKGDDFSIDDFIVEHPEYADQLRQLLPTLKAMADLGYSVGDDDSPSFELE